MKLYLVFSFNKDINKWDIENSFPNRAEALEEKEHLRGHLKAKEIKIIPTTDVTNKAVQEILKTLNGEA